MYCIFICRGAARQIEIPAAQPGAVLQKQTQRLSPDDRHLPKLILEADGFFPTSTYLTTKKPAALQAYRLVNNRLLAEISLFFIEKKLSY